MAPTEVDLKKTMQQYEQILSAISSFLIGVDSCGGVILWNPRAENIFDIDAGKVLGRPFKDCDIRWDWEALNRKISTCCLEKRQVRVDDFQYSRPGGGAGILGINLTPLINEGDEPGFLLAGADITERKKLEQQLAQLQKLDTIGRLAAGIAHEVNTPTQYISWNVLFLKDQFEKISCLTTEVAAFLQSLEGSESFSSQAAQIRELLSEIKFDQISRAIGQSSEGLERVTKIVAAMRDFSHPGSETMVDADLNRLITSTIEVTYNEWKNVAEIKTDFDPDLPLVECFPGEFNQVILNLLINAVHAVADAISEQGEGMGVIQISTSQEESMVKISIGDSGTGIPPGVQEHIFDPFFTTKEMGRGTGQGLYICHNVIVNKHHGSIHFETEKGKGTTFNIMLPVKQER